MLMMLATELLPPKLVSLVKCELMAYMTNYNADKNVTYSCDSSFLRSRW